MLLSAKPMTANNVSGGIIGIAKTNTPVPSIKIAKSNLFINTSQIPTYQSISDIILQTLNTGEILDYGDNTLFFGDGTSTNLNPIKNVLDISLQYNPKNLLSSRNHISDYMSNFYTDLEAYLPRIGTGPNGEIVYIDESNNLIINTINVGRGQELEIEFWTYETELNDTIYS